MKTKILLLVCFLTMGHIVQAQTLFTYGNHAVSKDEFLEAYNKNPDTTGNRAEKLKEYLDLYVNFRLKLQAAYDEKADANGDLKAESENFRAQLAESFINKQADINGLIHEAFLRSQKDILLQQVFVQVSPGNDTTDAFAQITKAQNELKAGKDFENISAGYSNVTSVKNVNGNIGYITVFTLPYSIENIVYELKPGDFSAIYKSKAGYHIFKNAGERPAAGRRKIEQLLFNTPSFLTAQQTDSVKYLADSVYTRLRSGTSFSSFQADYGHSTREYEGLNSIEVKVGDYSSDFEEEVFSLKTPGEISRPFKTQYGYNIVKLIEILPVATDENNAEYAAYLQMQIQNDGRFEAAKKKLTDKWLGITGFKEAAYNKNDLWSYTDSVLNSGKQPGSYKNIRPETVLFEFNKQKITVKDWIGYLQSVSNGETQVDYPKQMDDFVYISCNKYYSEHIEDFNPEASAQIKEFKEANMLFYIMDKQVWSKASQDTAGLRKYYETHTDTYLWKNSVTALVISAPDKNTIDSIAIKLKADPASWRNIVNDYENVYADSARFDMDQLPLKQKILAEKGFQSVPENNDDGTSYTFIRIINVYNQPQSKSFEEAKGIVINDYQQELEKTWLTGLKKKYPVAMNEAILKTLY